MKLVRVLGRWSVPYFDAHEVVLNVDAIVRVEEQYRPSIEAAPTTGVGLTLANNSLLIVSRPEWRRILRAAGATMPPSRPSKPRKP